ncbi:hypothetical protein AVEN_176694-1 [Araneus ventricosus]|uniref:Uncharacterized protein n=1 Tax=Araneus ventricosus TaxID=182803 RepID=A0A4Y2WYE9_ARAVE|nr:hypothetical protein AVEN_176694-1 [Araneus ventricosus]
MQRPRRMKFGRWCLHEHYRYLPNVDEVRPWNHCLPDRGHADMITQMQRARRMKFGTWCLHQHYGYLSNVDEVRPWNVCLPDRVYTDTITQKMEQSR